MTLGLAIEAIGLSLFIVIHYVHSLYVVVPVAVAARLI
jgi:hypothetical protein